MLVSNPVCDSAHVRRLCAHGCTCRVYVCARVCVTDGWCARRGPAVDRSGRSSSSHCIPLLGEGLRELARTQALVLTSLSPSPPPPAAPGLGQRSPGPTRPGRSRRAAAVVGPASLSCPLSLFACLGCCRRVLCCRRRCRFSVGLLFSRPLCRAVCTFVCACWTVCRCPLADVVCVDHCCCQLTDAFQ